MKRRVAMVPLLFMLAAGGCGKKGPPQPPLARVPAAPADLVATRRGAAVAIRFAAPSGNTDGSTPADLSRVDVYAMTGLPTLTPDDILRRGIRVGSIVINPPRDPDAPEGALATRADPAPGAIDQGAPATLSETLAIVDADSVELRSYLAVGINKRGRRGAFSARALVPMVAAPAAPVAPTLSYDETSITVRWTAAPPSAQPSAAGGPPVGYHGYVVGATQTRLTEKPVETLALVDPRTSWNTERCYQVHSVASAEALTLESEASPRVCVTPKDTFPPAAPTGLNTVPESGAVSLIWNANEESDLAGYFVLRAIAPAGTPVAINATPLRDTTFRDVVPSGARVTYAIQAVDQAGNVSPMSARAEESPR